MLLIQHLRIYYHGCKKRYIDVLGLTNQKITFQCCPNPHGKLFAMPMETAYEHQIPPLWKSYIGEEENNKKENDKEEARSS